MTFSDPLFLFIFLPFSLLFYWSLARSWGPVGGYAAITIASLMFYAWEGWFSAGLLIASVLVNLAIGIYLSHPHAHQRKRLRLTVFVLGMLYNFGLLILFKYVNQVWALFQPGAAATLLPYGIPVGISFYTFHQAVFLADAYGHKPETVQVLRAGEGQTPTVKGGLAYAAFILLFPQLIIGPISYLREMAPQLLRRNFGSIRRIDIEIGLMLLAMGLFKKIVIADKLALFSDRVFDVIAAGNTVSRGAAATAMLAYYFQLYFDFSGYSDAALGIGRLFGLRLPQNFDSPLRATGIADFYRRWHMTLTRVITRFLYTPIAVWGTRLALTHNMPRRVEKILSIWLPLLVNFQVIAIWHGATATFMLFGLIHGVWYIAETEIRATKTWKNFRKRTSNLQRQIIGQAITVAPLILTFALFRSSSVDAFGRLVGSLVVGQPTDIVMPGSTLPLLLLSIFVVWLLPNSVELLRRYRPAIMTFDNESITPGIMRLTWRPVLLWGVICCALMVTAVVMIDRKSPYLYGGF